MPKLAPIAVSPVDSAVEGLDYLRSQFREAVTQYSTGIESDILALRNTLSELQPSKRLSANKALDLQTMLTLLRQLDVKPQKGRRKDLRKIECLVNDLRKLAEDW